MSATPAAAVATTPAVEDRSCTAAKARRPSALEDRRVALLVVVELLLARDADDLDLDRHGRADGRGRPEWDVRLGGGAGLGLVERLADRDRLAGARDPDQDADVDLVVLALVGELDVERQAGAGGDPVDGGGGLEHLAADRDRVKPMSVRAGGRRAVGVPAAQARVQARGDGVRIQPA